MQNSWPISRLLLVAQVSGVHADMLECCRPLKMFPQGAIVCYVCSTKESLLVVVQGPSPHGEQYRTITYKRGATEIVHGTEECNGSEQRRCT